MLALGAKLAGRYRADACLGADGSRGLFEAIDTDTHVACALKVVRVDSLLRVERLLAQAEAMRALTSPHLPRVFDAGEAKDERLCFVVTELLRGADLASIAKQSGPLPRERVATWVRQAAAGLDAAHDAGLHHGALSLGSLFLARRGASPQVVVINLEEAALLARPSHRAFRPPDGGAGVAADVYALGHVAYALLCGEPYWQPELAQGDEALERALGGDPQPASARATPAGVELGESFDRWFGVATAVDPGRRFGRAGDAADALYLALGLQDKRALRKILRHSDAAPLGRTLPSDQLDPPPSVDPLGDTQAHAEAGLTEAAVAARSMAREKRAQAEPPDVPLPLRRTSTAAVVLFVALIVLAVVVVGLLTRG